LNTLKSSELILNPDGSIYHLNLLPEDIADTIIFVGDPDRVPLVSKHFDRIELKKHKREFCTHTGFIGKKRITVLSTGIGEDNIDIVLTELDALANIDFKTRTVKKDFKQLKIIRLGTSGVLRESMPLDSLLISSYAMSFSGLLYYYDWQPNENEKALQIMCQEQFKALPTASMLYVASGGQNVISQFESLATKGITLTCNGFYGPQRRCVRAPLIDVDIFGIASDITFENCHITNLEMETSAIYGLSRLLGHEACSMSAIVANRALQTFSKNPEQTIEHMIELVFERI